MQFYLYWVKILEIQILSLCCLKKKVLQYKILCILKDINQILSYFLDDIKNKDLILSKELEKEFSLLLRKINTIRDIVEREKKIEKILPKLESIIEEIITGKEKIGEKEIEY